MKKDLSEGIIENEKVSKNKNNNLYNEYRDKVICVNNIEISNASLYKRSLIMASSTIQFADILQGDKSVIGEHKLENSQIVNSQIYIGIEGDYTIQQQTTFNEASNNSTSQHNIYYQVANKNLENYPSKMKHQIHTKYNTHKHVYEICDLVKIQIAKIDYRPSDHSSVVLLLKLKEFPELNNPLINITVSIIEATRLQSNALASNK
ncbi:10597_t:CDS:2, partial [Scutellospora calospora]